MIKSANQSPGLLCSQTVTCDAVVCMQSVKKTLFRSPETSASSRSSTRSGTPRVVHSDSYLLLQLSRAECFFHSLSTIHPSARAGMWKSVSASTGDLDPNFGPLSNRAPGYDTKFPSRNDQRRTRNHLLKKLLKSCLNDSVFTGTK